MRSDELNPEQNASSKSLVEKGSNSSQSELFNKKFFDLKVTADEELKIMGNLSYPVFPGDTFLTKALSPFAKSKDIECTPILSEGNLPGKDHDFSVGPDGVSLISKVFGLAIIQENTFHLLPLITISDDKMMAQLTVMKQDFKGQSITAEKLVKLVVKSGINAREDLAETFNNALENVRDEDAFQENVIIARGITPQAGIDGFLHFHVKDEKDGEEAASKSRILTVQRGDLIGTIEAPIDGRTGLDIFGNSIESPRANPCRISAGSNVKFSKTTKEFYAKNKGMVVFSNHSLLILPIMGVEGNVNKKMGHIESSEKSVVVEGSVKSGSSISSSGNIVVKGEVEDSVLISSGSIEIRGRIIMKDHGKITADGDIITRSAENASLSSGRDVFIDSETKNCVIEAKDKVICTHGPGIICGGHTLAGKYIEANEIGSADGTPTEISLGIVCKEYDNDLVLRYSLENKIEKITDAFGDQDLDELAKTFSKEKAKKLRLLRASLHHSRTKVKKLEKAIDSVEKKFWRYHDLHITVNNILHANTTISIGQNHVLKITESVPHCVIHFDKKLQEIVISPIVENLNSALR